MNDCPFCRIAAGDGDAHTVYEDGRTVAFLDANPATAGHVLAAPKRHVEDLMRADAATATAVFETANRVADALDAVLEPDGFSVFHTTGRLVGTVDHAHVHLLPRDAGDAIRVALERESLADGDAAALVGRLHEEL